jgi:protein tyrosine/serine phosphatase
MNFKKLLLAVAIAALATATFKLSSRSSKQAEVPEPDARQQAASVDLGRACLSEQLDERSAQVQVALPLFHRVDERYLRGSQPAHEGVSLLKRMGVKAIVDLCSIYDHTDRVGIEAERLGLRYYWLPMSVWDPPTDQETARFLSIVTDPSNAPLYIFCADGLNRTGEMTAIYRIAHHGWAAEQAIKEMDEVGFNPYYWTLRNYVWDYARKRKPKAAPAEARKS